MRILLKVLLILLLFLGSLFGLVVLLGGGYGAKPGLPLHLIERTSPLIFAHRGAVDPAPENSAAALRQARERHYPAVELDIQISRDNHFFLFHDRTTDRLLGTPGHASRMDFSDLQQHDIRQNGQPTAAKVITLAQAVGDFGDDFIFYLDVKRYSDKDLVQIAERLDRFLGQHDLYDRVIVSSAHFLFTSYLEYRYPRIITCLEGLKPPSHHFFSLILRGFRPDFIATFHHQIDDDYAAWLKSSGMLPRYIAFTVKDSTELAKIRHWGIDKFIADDGAYLDGLLNSAHAP